MSLVFNAINQRAITQNLDWWQPPMNWSNWWGDDTVDPWADGVLWPNSNLPGGTSSLIESQNFEPMARVWGNGGMKKIIGFTRDANGVLLGNADVDLFLTTGYVFINDMTSDAGGYFEACSQYSGQNHYIRAYKSGSPDVAGVSRNNLVPV